MNKRAKTQFWIELIADYSCLIIANILSYILFRHIVVRIVEYPARDWMISFLLVTAVFLIVYIAFHNKIDIHKRSKSKEFIALFNNVTLTYMLLIVALALTKNQILDSRYILVSGYLASIFLSSVSRYFLKRWITGYFTKSKIASFAGIITTSDKVYNFVKELQADWTLNIKGVILLDDKFGVEADSDTYKTIENSLNTPIIATDDSFIDWIRSAPLDEVFINVDYTDSIQVKDIVEELEDMGITVHINIPTINEILSESKFDKINCKMIAGAPMATFSAAENDSRWLVFKRIADLFLGIIGCILSIPIIAVVAIPLLIESKGPLFFKQQRIGKNGRIFTMYKLRSMYVDAEERKAELMANNKMDGLMFKMDNDPRITKVGKFIRKYSIDELPQFFNVVIGDMSIIGTRPPTVNEFEQYESHHKRRLSMRPGITGMWQVSGRSNIQNFEEIVKLDCQYIDEWSLQLDMKIFVKTIGVVLTHKGAE